MTAMDDVRILGEITAFASEIFAKPSAMESSERREHLTFLQQKFDETATSSGYRYIACRRAPMLLTAIKLALDARRDGEESLAADFDRLIGVLVPGVRQDAQALLVKAKEA